MIPRSFIEELKYRSDIEQVISSYVQLKRQGNKLTGLCPFHNEKTPSFTVFTADGHYYCFGCHRGGDAITFIQDIENLEYIEAVKLLAQRAGMTVPEEQTDDRAARQKQRILELNRASARFFHDCLMQDTGQPGRSYLLGRGLTKKTVRSFGLGWAPDSWDALRDHLRAGGFTEQEMLAAGVVKQGRNGVYDAFRGRVMFPIIDLRGNVVAFGGRILSDGKGPKYLNSSDTPVFKKGRQLYALNFAKAAKSDMLLLCEGYMDVIAVHQAGFPFAVAGLGTALTPDQARLISQYAKKVVIAYDSDGAGQRAASKAINLFSELDVTVQMLELGDEAKDPDEYIKKFGAHRFENLIQGGKSAIRFEIDKLRGRFDMEDADARAQFLSQFCSLMAGIDNPLQREVHIADMAKELDISRDRLISTTTAIRKQRAGKRERDEAHNLRPYVQDKTGAVRIQAPPGTLSAAVAERRLIAMMMKNPDYYDIIRSKITAEDFTDEDNAAIWRALESILAQNEIPEPIYLSGTLSSAQMGKLTTYMEEARNIQFVRGEAEDYTKALQSKSKIKTAAEIGSMSPEEYARYISSLADDKK